MPRPVACPHCGEELEIPPEFRGREVRCAGCRNVFTPPDERGGEPRTARLADDFEDDLPSRRALRGDDDFPPRPSRRDEDRSYRDFDDEPPRRRRRKSGGTAWVWILLIGVFGFCVLPCGGFIVWAAILAFPDFQPYESPDGKFRGEFPGQPFTYTTADAAQPRHCVEFKRSFPTETYFIHYTDLPRTDQRGAAGIFQEAADRELANVVGGRDLGRTTQMYDGYEAKEVAIEHPNGGTTLVRFVLAGRRLYTVGITCEQGIDVQEPRAQHFFEAFKIKSADGPAPR